MPWTPQRLISVDPILASTPNVHGLGGCGGESVAYQQFLEGGSVAMNGAGPGSVMNRIGGSFMNAASASVHPDSCAFPAAAGLHIQRSSAASVISSAEISDADHRPVSPPPAAASTSEYFNFFELETSRVVTLRQLSLNPIRALCVLPNRTQVLYLESLVPRSNVVDSSITARPTVFIVDLLDPTRCGVLAGSPSTTASEGAAVDGLAPDATFINPASLLFDAVQQCVLIGDSYGIRSLHGAAIGGTGPTRVATFAGNGTPRGPPTPESPVNVPLDCATFNEVNGLWRDPSDGGLLVRETCVEEIPSSNSVPPASAAVPAKKKSPLRHTTLRRIGLTYSTSHPHGLLTVTDVFRYTDPIENHHAITPLETDNAVLLQHCDAPAPYWHRQLLYFYPSDCCSWTSSHLARANESAFEFRYRHFDPSHQQRQRPIPQGSNGGQKGSAITRLPDGSHLAADKDTLHHLVLRYTEEHARSPVMFVADETKTSGEAQARIRDGHVSAGAFRHVDAIAYLERGACVLADDGFLRVIYGRMYARAAHFDLKGPQVEMPERSLLGPRTTIQDVAPPAASSPSLVVSASSAGAAAAALARANKLTELFRSRALPESFAVATGSLEEAVEAVSRDEQEIAARKAASATLLSQAASAATATSALASASDPFASTSSIPRVQQPQPLPLPSNDTVSSKKRDAPSLENRSPAYSKRPRLTDSASAPSLPASAVLGANRSAGVEGDGEDTPMDTTLPNLDEYQAAIMPPQALTVLSHLSTAYASLQSEYTALTRQHQSLLQAHQTLQGQHQKLLLRQRQEQSSKASTPTSSFVPACCAGPYA
jgi:hypothetical protein